MDDVHTRTGLTVRATSIVVFIASLGSNIATTSVSITTVLRGDKGPVILYTGGYSGVNSAPVRFCRFCGLKLNSPVTISSIRNRNANSLLSTMVSRVTPRRFRSRSRSVVGITIVKGPGTNGSSLVGRVTNRRESVISGVTNAAHSTVSLHISHSNIGCGFVSATNLHEGDGIRSGVRGCDILHTGVTIRHTSIYIVVVSNVSNFARRSSGITKLTLRRNGTYVVTIGG